MADEVQRAGEVIEAGTTDFIAQCYELYRLPPFGSLVKTVDLPLIQYGIVCHEATTSLEPGRRPIARGKEKATEEEIYSSSPQLLKLLKSEFRALVVGHKLNDELYHYLPPYPAHVHSFVYLCSSEEVEEFSQSFNFLNILVNTRVPVLVDELVAACLRELSKGRADRHKFLVTAGKELALLLSNDFNRLKAILARLKV